MSTGHTARQICPHWHEPSPSVGCSVTGYPLCDLGRSQREWLEPGHSNAPCVRNSDDQLHLRSGSELAGDGVTRKSTEGATCEDEAWSPRLLTSESIVVLFLLSKFKINFSNLYIFFLLDTEPNHVALTSIELAVQTRLA